tara:strand:+ start:1028 stop:1597 length:570 start_codon:yes stop_codon:yes gene_type:complete
MIYDFGTEVTADAPTGGSTHITYSAGVDVTDGNDGFPALFGAGEQLYMQFEVTTAFTASGSPLAQFGVAIDDSATLAESSIVLGMTGGSVATKVGYDTAELVVGRKFHLAIPPFDDVMEDTAGLWPHTKSSGNLATFRGMKYMGIVIHNPMDVGSHAFTAGAVKARICTQASLGTAALSNVYASRMAVL